VQVFDANGGFLRQWPIAGWDTGHPEEKPYLAVDANENVYVTDAGHFRILVFDRMGNYLLSFGKQGMDERSFGWPAGIAVGPDGSAYVTDAHTGRVLVFGPLTLASGSAPVAAPVLLAPSADEGVNAGKVTLSGVSEPSSLVQLLVDGESVGLALADGHGDWSHIVDLDEPGEYVVVLQIVDTRGNVLSASEPVTLTVVGGAE